jgi:PAS domain S-box-containing protein
LSNTIISKDLFLNALAAIANGVVITDATGKVIYINEAVRKDFGNSFEMTMQEWIEKYELLDGEHGNKHTFETLPIVKALTYRISTTNEDLIVKNDNDIIKHLKISVSPIINNNDELAGTIMTYDDITEFKKQQIKLADAVQDKELLFTVIESTSDIVGATDFYGNVKYINSAAQRAFLSDKVKDFTKLHAKDFYTPESWNYLIGKMVPKAMKRGAAEGEITFIKTNGDLMKVSQVLVCKKDKDGKVDFFASISRDISDIKEKEELIIKQRAYLHTIIDANPNLIFVKDEEGKYKLVNKKFSKVASVSVKNIIGKNDFEIGIPKELAENYKNQDKEILKKGKSITFEEYYIDDKSKKET